MTSQLHHRARDVCVSQFQTKHFRHQLWRNSRIILIISCDSYALRQTDNHSGACAGPDGVSTQLRDASLRFPCRTGRRISSGIPTSRSVPYNCSKQWYRWLQYQSAQGYDTLRGLTRRHDDTEVVCSPKAQTQPVL